jgi:glycosyltransferase involved in cell wall biosynthesis
MPQKLLVWHFDRYRSFRIFTSSDSVRHIYHVIDPVANLNGDVELSRRADLVVVTSPRFLDHYRDLNKNVIRIGQGHDTAVAKSEIIPEETGLKDSIVLLGTITDDIDFALLQEIALRFPNPLFLIGPDKIIRKECREAFEKLLSQPGVRWLGAMPPSGFSKYLYSCKAGLITYDLSGISRNTLRSPLKVISYLAFGKCVISNIDCEIPELTGKGVYIASDKSDFIQKLQLALESKLEIDAAAIKNYLDSISYKKLLEQIFRQLGEELPEEFVS